MIHVSVRMFFGGAVWGLNALILESWEIKYTYAALQAATVLVAMASRKKLWRLKLSRRSPIWRPNILAICLCFFFYNLHPVIITTFTKNVVLCQLSSYHSPPL